MTKDAIWGTLMTAILAAIGWIYVQGLAIVQDHAQVEATRFTQANGTELQDRLEGILTDIDKRLAVMENNITWMRSERYYGGTAIGDPMGSFNPDEEPAPAPPSPPFEPRYQLKQQPPKQPPKLQEDG